MCRPLLRDHKEKLIEILANTDKKAKSSSKRNNDRSSDRYLRDVPGTPNFYGAAQKSLAKIMQLQKDHNASPTIRAKVKPKATTKNEILEMVDK